MESIEKLWCVFQAIAEERKPRITKESLRDEVYFYFRRVPRFPRYFLINNDEITSPLANHNKTRSIVLFSYIISHLIISLFIFGVAGHNVVSQLCAWRRRRLRSAIRSLRTRIPSRTQKPTTYTSSTSIQQ